MKNEIIIFNYFISVLLLILGLILCYGKAPNLGMLLVWISIVAIVFNFALDTLRK